MKCFINSLKFIYFSLIVFQTKIGSSHQVENPVFAPTPGLYQPRNNMEAFNRTTWPSGVYAGHEFNVKEMPHKG